MIECSSRNLKKKITEEKTTLAGALQLAQSESSQISHGSTETRTRLHHLESELTTLNEQITQLNDHLQTMLADVGVTAGLESSEWNTTGLDLVSIRSTVVSLSEHYKKLKYEKDALQEQLELAKLAVSELEHVGKEVVELKQQVTIDSLVIKAIIVHILQMDIEKRAREERWCEVKAILTEKEQALASTEEQLTARQEEIATLQGRLNELESENSHISAVKQRTDFRLDEMDKQLLEMLVDRERSEENLKALKTENEHLTATLSMEKERLERLVNVLRTEVERYRGGGGEIYVAPGPSSSHFKYKLSPQPSPSSDGSGWLRPEGYFDQSHASTVVEAGAAPWPRTSSEQIFTKSVSCQASAERVVTRDVLAEVDLPDPKVNSGIA